MLPMWKCCQYQCCQFQLKLGIGNGNIGNWQHLFRPGGPKREGGEAGDESWLGGERRRGARGEADADAGRRETTASRRIRAADARHANRGDQRYPTVPARDDRFDDRGPAVKRGRFPERSERAARKRADGAAAGGDGNLAIAETP